MKKIHPDFDYNKLKSFLTIVEAGSITAAAKILRRTQSAVSQTLQNLENSLGLTLIEWEGKQLKLTREGQQIHLAINERLKAMDETLSTIVQSGEEVGGCLEIGLLQDHSTRIQPHLLKAIASFRMLHPAVTFKLSFDTSANLEQALLDHHLDIGLLINFQERHRFSVSEVASEEHLVVTSSKYLKTHDPLKHLSDLLGCDLIDIDTHFTCFTPWIKKHSPKLISKLAEKSPTLIVPDFQAIKELALLDQGIAILPRYLIESELKTGRIIQVFPSLATLRVGVDCATLKGKRERLAETLFLEALVN